MTAHDCGGAISLQASSNEDGGHGERHQGDHRQWPEAGKYVARRHGFEKAALDDDQEMGEWNRLRQPLQQHGHVLDRRGKSRHQDGRSEEHTSELQSLMRISYAVFCLKKKKKNITTKNNMNKE